MAKDNDPNTGEIKNSELLSDRKQSLSEILQEGSKGNPSGTGWSIRTPSGTTRGDIKKPNLYYEAMQEQTSNSSKKDSKLIEKENGEELKPITNEPESDKEK